MSDVAPTGNPPPKISQNLLRVFPKVVKFTGVPGGGVTGKGSEIDKYLGVLYSLTPVGHGVDPGVGKPYQYTLRPLWNMFPWESLNGCHPRTDLGVRGKRVNTASCLQRGHSQEQKLLYGPTDGPSPMRHFSNTSAPSPWPWMMNFRKWWPTSEIPRGSSIVCHVSWHGRLQKHGFAEHLLRQ